MVHQVSDISVLNPIGELDPDEGNRLLHKIENLIRYQYRKIVINFHSVSHVNLRVISDLAGLAEVNSVDGIKLANLNRYTRNILKVAGVEHQFETYDSVAEAILSFHNPLMQSHGIH